MWQPGGLAMWMERSAGSSIADARHAASFALQRNICPTRPERAEVDIESGHRGGFGTAIVRAQIDEGRDYNRDDIF
jgi:hypothetical protein